jgi:uncharacterized protein
VFWLWLGLGILAALTAGTAVWLTWVYHRWYRKYSPFLFRTFSEKPLFILPHVPPRDDAEEVSFPTSNGLTLRGIYLRTAAPARKGVIIFGIEYGSNRFSCVPYCQPLLDAGYDVFSFEPRSQGDSDAQPEYEPIQWVTRYEVDDSKAALAYLKSRPDADPRGAGFFGISKGACAGLIAGSADPYLRCFVTDGVFATHTTMVPYMRKWVAIVSTRYWLQKALPTWFYGLIASKALHDISVERRCVFPALEKALPVLAPRPLFMIHGGKDTYIKPEMARSLLKRARRPKDLWIVEGAKHNQAFAVAGAEYGTRILAFFDAHLADPFPGSSAPLNRCDIISAPSPKTAASLATPMATDVVTAGK